MRKPTKTSLTHKLDKALSERVRSIGYCQRCKRVVDTLQCCHIFSRSNRAVRWDSDNVLCMCASCHFWSHKNPVLFGEFIKEFLGWKYFPLKQRASCIKKWSLEEMQALLEHLNNMEV